MFIKGQQVTYVEERVIPSINANESQSIKAKNIMSQENEEIHLDNVLDLSLSLFNDLNGIRFISTIPTKLGKLPTQGGII